MTIIHLHVANWVGFPLLFAGFFAFVVGFGLLPSDRHGPLLGASGFMCALVGLCIMAGRLPLVGF